MEKPISVRRNDFTKGIQELVTQTQLPPFVLRDALTIILHQVTAAADNEYNNDLERWQDSMQTTENDVEEIIE